MAKQDSLSQVVHDCSAPLELSRKEASGTELTIPPSLPSAMIFCTNHSRMPLGSKTPQRRAGEGLTPGRALEKASWGESKGLSSMHRAQRQGSCCGLQCHGSQKGGCGPLISLLICCLSCKSQGASPSPAAMGSVQLHGQGSQIAHSGCSFSTSLF